MQGLSSSFARHLFSQNKNIQHSYGWCRGFLQANIAIIPSKFGDAFEKFCSLNPSACPLLYRSKRGEYEAPPLASNSDIRSQLLKYWHHKDGEFHEELLDLTVFDWTDMVTFYLGCSFGFEEALQKAGIEFPKSEKGKNVSMYITNVKCNPSPPFSANMVVSMRAVKPELMPAVFEATYKLDCVHGAPIHIGSPAVLGIKNIGDVDFGDPTNIGENEIPVFWACGVTGVKAIQSAALPQCFSHAPGNMFICDEKTESFQEKTDSFQPSAYADLSPSVLQISEDPILFSVLSDQAKKKIEILEDRILHDIGKRGVNDICIKGDFLKSVLRLSQASSIGITTGFPCFPNDPVKEETDGIPGAISIAKALCALGKETSFIVEERNKELLDKIVGRCVELGILKKPVPVLVYDRERDLPAEQTVVPFLYPNGIEGKPRFDHLVSIERTSPAKDGTYRNCKGDPLPEKIIAPIEDLFKQALNDQRIATSGIGDGGNEMGMGKAMENIIKYIPHGACIASSVSSDYLITAGVSNWGGHALAVALYVLSTCSIHLRYIRRGLAQPNEEVRVKDDFLNSVEQEEEILSMLIREGVRDGLTGKADMSVDGFQFHPHHADMIKKLQELLE